MKRFTVTDDEEMARLWAQGASIREIAEALGRPSGSVACRIWLLRRRHPERFPHRVGEQHRDNIRRGRRRS